MWNAHCSVARPPLVGETYGQIARSVHRMLLPIAVALLLMWASFPPEAQYYCHPLLQNNFSKHVAVPDEGLTRFRSFAVLVVPIPQLSIVENGSIQVHARESVSGDVTNYNKNDVVVVATATSADTGGSVCMLMLPVSVGDLDHNLTFTASYSHARDSYVSALTIDGLSRVCSTKQRSSLDQRARRVGAPVEIVSLVVWGCSFCVSLILLLFFWRRVGVSLRQRLWMNCNVWLLVNILWQMLATSNPLVVYMLLRCLIPLEHALPAGVRYLQEAMEMYSYIGSDMLFRGLVVTATWEVLAAARRMCALHRRSIAPPWHLEAFTRNAFGVWIALAVLGLTGSVLFCATRGRDGSSNTMLHPQPPYIRSISVVTAHWPRSWEAIETGGVAAASFVTLSSARFAAQSLIDFGLLCFIFYASRSLASAARSSASGCVSSLNSNLQSFLVAHVLTGLVAPILALEFLVRVAHYVALPWLVVWGVDEDSQMWSSVVVLHDGMTPIGGKVMLSLLRCIVLVAYLSPSTRLPHHDCAPVIPHEACVPATNPVPTPGDVNSVSPSRATASRAPWFLRLFRASKTTRHDRNDFGMCYESEMVPEAVNSSTPRHRREQAYLTRFARFTSWQSRDEESVAVAATLRSVASLISVVLEQPHSVENAACDREEPHAAQPLGRFRMLFHTKEPVSGASHSIHRVVLFGSHADSALILVHYAESASQDVVVALEREVTRAEKRQGANYVEALTWTPHQCVLGPAHELRRPHRADRCCFRPSNRAGKLPVCHCSVTANCARDGVAECGSGNERAPQPCMAHRKTNVLLCWRRALAADEPTVGGPGRWAHVACCAAAVRCVSRPAPVRQSPSQGRRSCHVGRYALCGDSCVGYGMPLHQCALPTAQSTALRGGCIPEGHCRPHRPCSCRPILFLHMHPSSHTACGRAL